MDADWVIDIQEQCQKAEVAFFFKQWGGKNKKKSGRLLNGKTYDEMPELELQNECYEIKIFLSMSMSTTFS